MRPTSSLIFHFAGRALVRRQRSIDAAKHARSATRRIVERADIEGRLAGADRARKLRRLAASVDVPDFKVAAGKVSRMQDHQPHRLVSNGPLDCPSDVNEKVPSAPTRIVDVKSKRSSSQAMRPRTLMTIALIPHRPRSDRVWPEASPNPYRAAETRCRAGFRRSSHLSQRTAPCSSTNENRPHSNRRPAAGGSRVPYRMMRSRSGIVIGRGAT